MKYILSLLILWGLIGAINAQVIITPFGGAYENTEGQSISFSVGEVAIETLDNNEAALTQGFQQPEIKIKELPQYEITIYDGLILNDEKGNGYFKIDGLENYPEHELYVLNRWGEILYRSENYENNWGGYFDGTPLPQATYYYVLKLGDDIPELKGNLYILKNN